jgi:CheY-like chemotaxis protein
LNRCATVILVVDDNREVREALAELLAFEGYQVKTAAHGAEAMEKLRSGLRPAVVVTDVIMPVMDGWDFCRELRADPTTAAIPRIAITSSGFSLQTLRGQLGVSDVAWKPIEAGELLAAIARHVPGARPWEPEQ